MATAIFIIPQKDADGARAIEGHLRDVAGLSQIRVQHEPFDPFGPEAETRAVDEARITVSYDPAETTCKEIEGAFTALGIHILDVREPA